MIFLILRCWSHELRYHLYDWQRKELLAHGTAERVSLADGCIVHHVPGWTPWRRESPCPDHRTALALVLETLSLPGPLRSTAEIAAVGHRVVHGGEKFTRPVLIDAGVLEQVRSVSDLAPLHNGPNLAGIEAALDLLPGTPQAAFFDTAFHQSMPPHSFLYPLPYEWYGKYGVRRYGFHGATHLFAARRGAAILGRDPSDCNLITAHLGSGVSLCAVRKGKSYDTTMGLTPLEGAMMETRCGDIDAGIPAFIMQQEHLSTRELGSILNQKSGLAGVVGAPLDREGVRAGAAAGDPACRLAREMEAYRLKKYVGAYAAAMGGVDAVVFTAGAGETDWELRAMILEGLEFLGIRLDPERNRRAVSGISEAVVSADGSAVRVMVVPACEELVLAEETARLLEVEPPGEYTFARPGFVRR